MTEYIDPSYIKLGAAALLPVIMAAIMYLLDKKTAFGRIGEKKKQVIYGITFGILAVIGTEWGIPINGAQCNCRDAAVLVAGLLFGSPAGIIAGLIGGIERWIAVAWGIGSFTRVACTVSTIIAGIYAACLRKFMFENKKPGWLLALAIGVVLEVFHMTMVFLTNISQSVEAMRVVKVCTGPMVTANAVSVMLAVMVVSLLAKEHLLKKRERVNISQRIQRWMLVSVIIAFALTSVFVYQLQDGLSTAQRDQQLTVVLDDVKGDIEYASDVSMLNQARVIAAEVDSSADLNRIAEKYEVAEISIVDEHGIIVRSSEPQYLGFDMASGGQSAEFLCLLNGEKEFIQKYGSISSNPKVRRKYAGISTDSGFLQIGYDSENIRQNVSRQLTGVTDNRHIGEHGFVFVADARHNVISATDGKDRTVLQNSIMEDNLYNRAREEKTYSISLDGTECYCRCVTSEGYYVISALPVSEALQVRNIALFVNAYLEILVFALLFGMIYFLIKNMVVKQIKDITRSLGKITGGDLDETVNVRTSEEFASLSDDINTTVDTLKKYIAEASARIDQELEFAKQIQTSSLPSVFPAFPNRKEFDIHATMHPAKEVGGDFYDFYMTGRDDINFLVADVSGKGIPAAMFMMKAKTELKGYTEAEMDLDDVFTLSNQELCSGNDAGMFVTAWQGRIDLKSGVLRFVNAGHNPPLLKRAGGSFEFLRSRPGFVLAGMDGLKYKVQEIQLEPGDEIYLYTDGVTEAANENNELYGEQRLLDRLNSENYESMKELCETVKEGVDSFAGETPQFDDITMLAVKYYGSAE